MGRRVRHPPDPPPPPPPLSSQPLCCIDQLFCISYAQHAVLTDRSSYAFSARLFGMGSGMLVPDKHTFDIPVTVGCGLLADVFQARVAIH